MILRRSNDRFKQVDKLKETLQKQQITDRYPFNPSVLFT